MTLQVGLLKSLVFNNENLREQALTHKSFLNESANRALGHNERLEFLGDAVLDLVLSDYLMHRFPELNEGDLSKVRAGLVNEATLAKVAVELNLQFELKLGKGEQQSGGSLKPRLLASVFEALVGAFYLDAGFEKVKEFIFATFKNRIEAVNPDQHFETDYKTRLQEILQERFRRTPQYVVVDQEGPDHNKVFHVEVRLDTKTLAMGAGKSKKQAEQEAAQMALKGLI